MKAMFADLTEQKHVVELLQKSLERGRLGHGYLFSGDSLEPMTAMAKALAKTLNCQSPSRKSETGLAIESCDRCSSCRRIEQDLHPDVQWVRPESKTRIIAIDQVRELIQSVNLKPTEAAYKVGVIVCADRMKTEAANAFLKTLEEPPSRSILILLSTAPDRILETIISRCLRLQFASQTSLKLSEAEEQWLEEFAAMASEGTKSLLGRYNLLGLLMARLGALKEETEKVLEERSPLNKYPDAEKDLKDRWESELNAAIEGEYRRKRMELLQIVQWWMRDVWLETSRLAGELHSFPGLREVSAKIAERIGFEEATNNLRVLEGLQRLLHTNAQEALALEVNLLRLKL
jgi:DNA polymerase III subunit delta'